MTKENLYVWACDYSENTGEGKLAHLFLEKKNLNKKFNIVLNKKRNYFKYSAPFLGILYCWSKSLKNHKVCYLNYLPLWNFLIFIFLPKKTILGPITGGANYTKTLNFNFIVRDKLFPIFYKISCFFLEKKFKDIIFSTDLLSKYLSNDLRKKSKLNFILESFKKRKKSKKKIDFLIYYRKHKNKSSLFQYGLIKKLTSIGLKINVVGDELNLNGVKNHGYKSNKIINNLQSKSRFTIASKESIYSFFTLECLSNNMRIIIDPKEEKRINFLKKEFIFIDFNQIKTLSDYKKFIRS